MFRLFHRHDFTTRNVKTFTTVNRWTQEVLAERDEVLQVCTACPKVRIVKHVIVEKKK